MRKIFVAVTALLVTVSTAQAGVLSPVKDEAVRAECSDCHMAYPAVLLPQASWKKIIGNLSDHYGDDASLDDATTKHVLDYYVKNSNDVIKAELEKVFEQSKADAAKAGKKVKYVRAPGKLRTAKKWSAQGTPERIQDLRRFKRKHSFSGRCEPTIQAIMTRGKVNSLAMCAGCHAGMPINGSSGIRMQFMEKMTDAEKQAAMSAEELRCLDD